jgi:hypothetical protein
MWPSSPAASAADYGFDQTVDVSFHNCDYTLRVSATESHLLVEAEQKDDGARWCSEFSSRCAYRSRLRLLFVCPIALPSVFLI